MDRRSGQARPHPRSTTMSLQHVDPDAPPAVPQEHDFIPAFEDPATVRREWLAVGIGLVGLVALLGLIVAVVSVATSSDRGTTQVVAAAPAKAATAKATTSAADTPTIDQAKGVA